MQKSNEILTAVFEKNCLLLTNYPPEWFYGTWQQCRNSKICFRRKICPIDAISRKQYFWKVFQVLKKCETVNKNFSRNSGIQGYLLRFVKVFILHHLTVWKKQCVYKINSLWIKRKIPHYQRYDCYFKHLIGIREFDTKLTNISSKFPSDAPVRPRELTNAVNHFVFS